MLAAAADFDDFTDMDDSGRTVVDEVLRDAAGKIRGYEIRWANGDCNRISAGKVRARQRGTAKG